MKHCTKCHKEKSYSEFYKDRNSPNGYTYWCKECKKIDKRKRWKENPECRERQKEHSKKYFKNNRERILRQIKKNQKDNKERVRAYSKTYYKNNKKKINENSRKYYKINKKKIQQNTINWVKRNPDKIKVNQQNRRARLNNSKGTITGKEWKELLKEANYKCLCCGTTEKLSLDHIIPIVRSGDNTKENAQVLCRSCNSKKHAKTIDYRIMRNS